MITPFPVPTHSRLQDTTRAVILTNEKPNLPVPATHTEDVWLNPRSEEEMLRPPKLFKISHYYMCVQKVSTEFYMYVALDSVHTATLSSDYFL